MRPVSVLFALAGLTLCAVAPSLWAQSGYAGSPYYGTNPAPQGNYSTPSPQAPAGSGYATSPGYAPQYGESYSGAAQAYPNQTYSNQAYPNQAYSNQPGPQTAYANGGYDSPEPAQATMMSDAAYYQAPYAY